MDEQRKSARWRKRRIIYNNDGDDIIDSHHGWTSAHGHVGYTTAS